MELIQRSDQLDPFTWSNIDSVDVNPAVIAEAGDGDNFFELDVLPSITKPIETRVESLLDQDMKKLLEKYWITH